MERARRRLDSAAALGDTLIGKQKHYETNFNRRACGRGLHHSQRRRRRQAVPAPAAGADSFLSVEDELKTFQLPEGYRLEPVLADPDIKEPVMCAFDGNGRLFVAEMRTYMQEIDGKNQHTPLSRVSMHYSSKGDGKFDQHTVFIDKLVLPRMILPLADGLLVGETDTKDLHIYRDTDGDGVADSKILVMKGGGQGGNLEHQPSGLIWGLDNWMYAR